LISRFLIFRNITKWVTKAWHGPAKFHLKSNVVFTSSLSLPCLSVMLLPFFTNKTASPFVPLSSLHSSTTLSFDQTLYFFFLGVWEILTQFSFSSFFVSSLILNQPPLSFKSHRTLKYECLNCGCINYCHCVSIAEFNILSCSLDYGHNIITTFTIINGNIWFYMPWTSY